MRSSLVLTVIGPDRPGLVELIASTVAAHGGNWEESRMAHLAGQFAGILNVSLPEAQINELRHALESLSAQGLRVVSVTTAPPARSSVRILELELTGTDREGIVRDVARVLAARSVNVEELDTRHEEAPIAGGALFHARALLHLPAQLDIAELRKTLEALADDLMVDVSLLAADERPAR
jgi:glycine cleavage system regulatory protein